MRRWVEALRGSGAGLFFLAAAVLALLAGLSVWSYLLALNPTEQVWVTSRDLAPGTVITERDLQSRAVPADAVPKGAVRERSAVVGQRVRFGLVTGDVIRAPHLVEGASDLAYKLTDLGAESANGYRAVKLPGELVPSPERLVPGDRLDLIGVLPVRTETVNSQIAIPIGVATVLDVIQTRDKDVVLVALPAGEVPRLALTLRVGTLTVAVQGTDHGVEPVPSLPLEALTALATLETDARSAADAGRQAAKQGS